MEAALTAAKRGHRVILCEKEDRLGGTLNIADTVSFKDRMKLYKDRMIQHVLNYPNIQVRLKLRGDPAVGGRDPAGRAVCRHRCGPRLSAYPGSGGRQCDHRQGCTRPGGSGGPECGHHRRGLVGAETGIHLLELGRNVTIVEMTGRVAADCAGSHHEACISRLKDAKVLMNTKCTRVTENAVIAETEAGETLTLPADTVILAAGMKALTEEAYQLGQNVADFAVIGDAVKPGKIQDATRTGFFEAMHLGEKATF